MPGPRAVDRRTKAPADNSPNAKTAARLQRRRDAFSPGNEALGLKCHMPGSQNRKK